MERMITCAEISSLQSILDDRETSGAIKKFFQKKRWKKTLKRTEDQQIMDFVGMAELPLIVYLLYLKYNKRIRLIDIGNDCMIRFGTINIANMSYLAVYIHFIHIKDHVLRIEGNISLPSVIRKRCSFYAVVNGIRQNCVFAEAKMDRKIAGEIYETRTVFLLEYRLIKNVSTEIVFAIETDHVKSICGKINAMRFSPVADCIENQYAVRAGWILTIVKNKICCRFAEEGMPQALENVFLEQIRKKMPKQAERICGIREEYFRRKSRKKKQVWLFFDRIDKADDNGEAMFSYVCSLKKKEVDAYFVIGRNTPDFERLKSIGQVVEALSFEHCVLLLLADYILTSQLNGYVENPFGECEEYFRDLSHQPKVIFLQHGVTKDDQTRWLNRYYQNLYAVVASAEAERKAFLANSYFYQEDQVWLTGMPRYDVLELISAASEGSCGWTHNGLVPETNTCAKKYILIMPTWRENLMEQRISEELHVYRWYLKKGFDTSEYFQHWHSLLNNGSLKESCKKFNYQLVFMPHPIMQPYIGAFRADEAVIELPYDTSWRDLFARCELMITDYSSVAFDFAYLKKPVIYYQFDREQFFSSHTYAEGYFDYKKMGFGEIAVRERQVVELLIRYMEKGCGMPDLYRNRVESFFAYHDHDSCKRIVQRIVEGDENGIPKATVSL